MDTWDDYYALHQEIFGVPPPESGPQARDVEKETCDAN